MPRRRTDFSRDEQRAAAQAANWLVNTSQGRSTIPYLLSAVLIAAIGYGVWFIWIHRTPSAAPPMAATGQVIRIATWNLEQFSPNRAALDLRKMVDVIHSGNFDLLAAQEIKAEGEEVDRLVNVLGAPWKATSLSPLTGNHERFVFLYNSLRVAPVGSAKPIDLPEGVFDRHPYQGTFKAGGFEFTLITCHLFYGKNAADHEKRAREMQALAQYASQLAAHDAVKDVMVLGDFNEQHAHPNLHYFTEIGWKPLNADPSNLGGTEVFDNIVIDPHQTTEWTGTAASVHYDDTMYHDSAGTLEEKREAERLAKEQVSDHRPAYADFRD